MTRPYFMALAWLLASGPALATIDCTQPAPAMPATTPPVTAASRTTAPVSSACLTRQLDWPADAALVQVQEAGEVSGATIAGAFRLARSEVAQRLFLQGRPLVLIGSGRNDQALLSLCTELRNAGWPQVQVLAGGLRRWQSAGRPLQGNLAALRQMVEPPVADLAQWHRAGRARWLGVGYGDGAPRQELLNLPKEARFAPAGDDLTAIVPAEWRDNPALPVVIAAADAAAGHRVVAALQQQRTATYDHVWVLANGWTAFTQELQRLGAIAGHAGQPLHRPCGLP